MHANTQHQWKKKRKQENNDFSLKKKTLNPHCTSGILKSNPHRLNLPLSFHPPPPRHTVLNKIAKGVKLILPVLVWECRNVGQKCMYNCNKQKQTTQNNLWILEKCHGKDLIQNVEYASKTKNKQHKQQQQQNNAIY